MQEAEIKEDQGSRPDKGEKSLQDPNSMGESWALWFMPVIPAANDWK
jgi:hypothetical protein